MRRRTFLAAVPIVAAGTALGRVFHAVDRSHRRLALVNLQMAFPVRPVAEREAIAREMFAHFGRLLMVLLKFSTMTADVAPHDRARVAAFWSRAVAACSP